MCAKLDYHSAMAQFQGHLQKKGGGLLRANENIVIGNHWAPWADWGRRHLVTRATLPTLLMGIYKFFLRRSDRRVLWAFPPYLSPHSCSCLVQILFSVPSDHILAPLVQQPLKHLRGGGGICIWICILCSIGAKTNHWKRGRKILSQQKEGGEENVAKSHQFLPNDLWKWKNAV